jgi:hypothetical protein
VLRKANFQQIENSSVNCYVFLNELKNLKKALIIASLTEAILAGIWIWLFIRAGHSGFTLGGTFHLPSSIVGVMIGEKLRDYSLTVAAVAYFVIPIILQTILLALVFWLVLERVKTRRPK